MLERARRWGRKKYSLSIKVEYAKVNNLEVTLMNDRSEAYFLVENLGEYICVIDLTGLQLRSPKASTSERSETQD